MKFLEDFSASGNLGARYASYAEASARLSAIMDTAADRSNLSADMSVEGHYLVSVLVQVLPNILQDIARMRRLAADYAHQSAPDSSLTQDQINNLQSVYTQLESQHFLMQEALARAKNYESSLSPIIAEKHDSEIEHKLADVFKKLYASGPGGYLVSEASEDAIVLQKIYHGIYDKIEGEFYEKLVVRHEAYILKRYLILCSSVIAIFGLVSIIAFLTRLLSRTEHSKKKEAAARADLTMRIAEKERMESQLKQYVERMEIAQYDAMVAKDSARKEASTVAILRNIAATANTAENIDQGIQSTIRLVCGYMQWPVGHAYMRDAKKNMLLPMAIWHLHNPERYKDFVILTHNSPIMKGVGLPGMVWEKQEPIWVAEAADPERYPRGKLAIELGLKAGFAFPIFIDGEVTYVLEFFAGRVTAPDQTMIDIMRDIDNHLAQLVKRTRADEALNVAIEDAGKANAAKSEFLANMSHELRTPLNSILGMSNLLRESNLDREQCVLVDAVLRSSSNLLEIVNDILDISKIEAREMRLEQIGFDPKYVLLCVIDELEHLARSKNLPINKHYETQDLPYLVGDPSRLTRVLTNLVGNAIKYTDKGHIDIRAAFTTIDADHVTMRFDISDTGIGIPESKYDVVFQKFVQADTSTTRKYGGTGLGLAITKELVELMGGRIGLKSVVGKGSTFWIEIPFATTDKLHEEQASVNAKKIVGVIPLDRARVLIAEDHPMNQMLIRKLMQKFGIGHFEIVENGAQALEAYKKERWDIILMDCHMPDLNGYEATVRIREMESATGTQVPIIAMTANAMVGDKEKCLECGMNEYISKPIDIQELKEMLGQWLKFENAQKSANEHEPPISAKEDLSSEPLVDLTQLQTFTDGDREAEIMLIQKFVEQSDKNLETLRETKDAAGENKPWTEAAHMFKGGASTIGAKYLADLCRQGQLFTGSASERGELFKKIDEVYKKVKQILIADGKLPTH